MKAAEVTTVFVNLGSSGMRFIGGRLWSLSWLFERENSIFICYCWLVVALLACRKIRLLI